MKKIIIALISITFFAGNAQFNDAAPWMKNVESNKKTSQNDSPAKFDEIVDAFNDYWKNKDHTKKGSGYKPFKRWENFWSHFVKEDGTLPTPKEMWKIWEQKQAMRTNLADVSDWQSMGPYTHTINGSWSAGQGRVNVIAIDPNDSNTYYVGSPGGGIWRSTDAGTTWTPLSDDLPQIGVSAIAIDPADSNIIYIGTGDDDAGDTYSIGVLKSTDGGTTWNNTGLVFNNTSSNINEIYLDPNDNTTIFVSSNTGFYKSTDAGVTFNRTLSANLRDAKLKPTDSNIIYAATSTQVYKSINNGDSFTLSSTGLPGSGGRIALAVTPAAPNNIYVLSATSGNTFQGVYKSTDNGDNFVRTDNGGDAFGGSSQAWYDLGFAVSDTDENEIFVATVDVFKSTNGGASFTKWNSWSSPTSANYTHADVHMIRYFDGELFFGTDGGIYKSTDGNTTTDLTEGLAIGQFYRISVSPQTSANMVGGLQDNGGYAYSDSNWKNYYGADGMDTAVDPTDPNKYYGFIQNGGGLYFSNNAGASLAGSINGPEQGNWITPLKMNKEGELYAGYNSLYRLNGNAFTAVSSNFGSRIDRIEIDPVDSDIIYLGINRDLHKSTDRGVTFSVVESFSANINSIAVSSTDNQVVYALTNSSVLKSVDGGSTFSNITFNLPSESKLIIKHQGSHPDNPIYVGTSLGVYRLDDTANTWEPFLNNLPNVAVRDLEINLNDANITAGTYGRGVWRSNIPVQLADNDVRLLSINLTPNQIACGNLTPSITVRNNGLNTISTIDINYSLDDGTPSSTSWSGSLSSENTVDITLPEIDTNVGSHKLDIEVSIPNDAVAGNNESTINFLRNDTEDAQNVNEFETTDNDLLVQGTLWERGAPTGTLLNTASSGTQVYGTNLDGNYSDETISYLISRCYDLTAIQNPTLTFDMAFDMEFDWDFINVEYSIDGGQVWSILGTPNDPNWYNSDTTPGSNCFNCPGAQWTGTDATLKEYSYDLNAFANENNFIFRFNFVSDQLENQEGVIIDDLVITGTLSADELTNSPAFNLYPNPSSDIFNINWRNASEVSYSIYDITGKVIFSKKNIEISDNTAQIDLSNYAQGTYFVKVTLDNTELTKMLLKK